MTIVAITAITYAIFGITFSMAADFGYKRRYSQPMSNKLWFAGVVLWPAILFFGKRRR